VCPAEKGFSLLGVASLSVDAVLEEDLALLRSALVEMGALSLSTASACALTRGLVPRGVVAPRLCGEEPAPPQGFPTSIIIFGRPGIGIGEE